MENEEIMVNEIEDEEFNNDSEEIDEEVSGVPSLAYVAGGIGLGILGTIATKIVVDKVAKPLAHKAKEAWSNRKILRKRAKNDIVVDADYEPVDEENEEEN